MGMSRAKLAKHVLSKVEGFAKFRQIPLFPPLSKGDEGGFLDCFAPLACLAREDLGFLIIMRTTHQIGGMKISSRLANNFDYCSAKDAKGIRICRATPVVALPTAAGLI